MSKKKSSMSLKDFHGGTIPSDLALPSAPGGFVRPTTFSGYDRSLSRPSSAGRPDQWVRPNSSPAARIFDDKTPFLGPTVPIGRHFDEDERKPLDGSGAPRRTINDDHIRVPPNRVDLKPEPLLGGRVSGLAPASQPVNSYIGRVVDGATLGSGLLNTVGNVVQSRAPANPWNMRKEPAASFEELIQSPEMRIESKMAHASALDKVSSGKWQTKQFPFQTDCDVSDGIGSEKVGSCLYEGQKYHTFSGKDADGLLGRDTGRGVTIGDGNLVGRKEFTGYDGTRIHSSGQQPERGFPGQFEKTQPPLVDGRLGVPVAPPTTHFDASERPKLKLLPRTKPLEGSECLVPDAKTDSLLNIKSVASGADNESQYVERPKLNLKPRTQTMEQSDGITDRGALFGGARPREMVLKDRGIDDTVLSNQDASQQLERVKPNAAKVDRVIQHTYSRQQGERITNNASSNSQMVKKPERQDQQIDNDRPDMKRTNWRKETWKNKETERNQPQLQRERPPSPESWRKPAEPEKTSPPHFGKTASALDLTQAFSRSIFDPKASTGSYKAQPGKSQIPFSRLMDTSQQINGY